MLQFFSKFLLVATAFGPVLLVSAAVEGIKARAWSGVPWSLVIAAFCLWAICEITMLRSIRGLSRHPIQIKQIKPADKEILGFVIAYLLPMARGAGFIDAPSLIVVLVIFFVVVMTSNAYHTNPLMSLRGWHFYEVIVEDVGYTLVSRRHLHNVRDVKVVVKLTDYMLADATAPAYESLPPN